TNINFCAMFMLRPAVATLNVYGYAYIWALAAKGSTHSAVSGYLLAVLEICQCMLEMRTRYI
ncbi:hypothetical protein BaRGS_00031888, partial [Batillaria attramentaria]